MKSSEALRRVKSWAGCNTGYFYVCLKIKHLGGSKTAVYNKLERIFPCYDTAEDWLEENVEGFKDWEDQATDDEFVAAMRQYRLRWIDWMIEGYEAVGD